MSDVSRGPDATGPKTVQQLHDQLVRIRGVLATAAAVAGELDRWSDALPLRHVPDGEPVLATDLISTTVEDRDELSRRVRRAEDLVSLAGDALDQVRDVVVAQTGTFAAVGGFGAADGTVEVSLVCGGRDDGVFDGQRRAARQTGLTFHDPSRTWRGKLPAALHEAPERWRAITEAVDAGAGARIHP